MSRGVAPNGWVSSKIEQALDHRWPLLLNCENQRQIIATGLKIDIRAPLDQQLYCGYIIAQYRFVEGRLWRVAKVIGVTVSLQEAFQYARHTRTRRRLLKHRRALDRPYQRINGHMSVGGETFC